jgi:hypothetical protein
MGGKMGYHGLTLQRAARLSRRRRSRILILISMLLLAYITVVGLLWVISKGITAAETPPTLPGDQLVITYGFSRQPQTRTFTVDLPPAPKGKSSPTEFNVRLAGDLRKEGGPGEFPDSQVTVGVNRLTETRLSLSVTANPWTPERVSPGVYNGRIQIRGPGINRDFLLTAWLQSREKRWAVIAFSLLFSGELFWVLW